MSGKAKYAIPTVGPILAVSDAIKRATRPPQSPNAPDPNLVGQQALNTELAFRPQFREQDVQDILSFAKASADAERQFGFPLAEDERALFEKLEPETFQVQRALAAKTLEQLTGQLAPDVEQAFRERFRSEEALGGRLGSPVGSASVARQLAELTANTQENAANRALSFLGRSTLQNPNVVSNRSSSDFGQFVSPYIQGATSVFGTQGNFYTTKLNNRAAQQRQLVELGGDIGKKFLFG